MEEHEVYEQMLKTLTRGRWGRKSYMFYNGLHSPKCIVGHIHHAIGGYAGGVPNDQYPLRDKVMERLQSYTGCSVGLMYWNDHYARFKDVKALVKLAYEATKPKKPPRPEGGPGRSVRYRRFFGLKRPVTQDPHEFNLKE